MAKNLTSRQQQAIDTKMRIYNKTIELLKKHDYEKITIAEICKNAEVSVGNFYNYFSSKEELIVLAYPTFDDYIDDSFEITEDTKCIEAIRRVIWAQTRAAEGHGTRIIAQCLRVQLQSHGKYVIEESRSFHTYLLSLVQRAIEGGEFANKYDAQEIASTILRISRGVIFDWAIRDGGYSITERALQDLDNYFKILI